MMTTMMVVVVIVMTNSDDDDDGDDGDHLERLLSTKRLQGRRWWRSKPKQLL